MCRKPGAYSLHGVPPKWKPDGNVLAADPGVSIILCIWYVMRGVCGGDCAGRVVVVVVVVACVEVAAWDGPFPVLCGLLPTG